MPTYEYICDKCNQHKPFDVFQSIIENAYRKCPKCKKGKVKRLMGSGGGIIFKGSGFYETDYKRHAQKDSKTGSEAPSKTETKSESKATSDSKSSTQDRKTTTQSPKKKDT